MPERMWSPSGGLGVVGRLEGMGVTDREMTPFSFPSLGSERRVVSVSDGNGRQRPTFGQFPGHDGEGEGRGIFIYLLLFRITIYLSSFLHMQHHCDHHLASNRRICCRIPYVSLQLIAVLAGREWRTHLVTFSTTYCFRFLALVLALASAW
jgi:hypothetical protein